MLGSPSCLCMCRHTKHRAQQPLSVLCVVTAKWSAQMLMPACANADVQARKLKEVNLLMMLASNEHSISPVTLIASWSVQGGPYCGRQVWYWHGRTPEMTSSSLGSHCPAI